MRRLQLPSIKNICCALSIIFQHSAEANVIENIVLNDPLFSILNLRLNHGQFLSIHLLEVAIQIEHYDGDKTA